MRENPHDRILKNEPKKQHISTVPKSCSFILPYYVSLLDPSNFYYVLVEYT